MIYQQIVVTNMSFPNQPRSQSIKKLEFFPRKIMKQAFNYITEPKPDLKPFGIKSSISLQMKFEQKQKRGVN